MCICVCICANNMQILGFGGGGVRSGGDTIGGGGGVCGSGDRAHIYVLNHMNVPFPPRFVLQTSPTSNFTAQQHSVARNASCGGRSSVTPSPSSTLRSQRRHQVR